MLSWALVFLVIAIIAAIFGFGGIAATSAGIAKLLFFVLLVIFLSHSLRATRAVCRRRNASAGLSSRDQRRAAATTKVPHRTPLQTGRGRSAAIRVRWVRERAAQVTSLILIIATMLLAVSAAGRDAGPTPAGLSRVETVLDQWSDRRTA